MSLRTWLSVSSVFIVAGIYAYLLAREQIVAGDEKADTIAARHEDPLLDLAYTAASRAKDFEAFGMPEDMVKAAVDRARHYEDSGRVERLRLLIDDAPEPLELARALCGQDADLRPRYGALRYLVVEVQGQRRAIDVDRVSSLQRADWADAAPLSAVFDDAELTPDRKPDATLMAIAAILSAQEGELLNGYKPWGRGLAGTWSWDKVKKSQPGLEERTLEYLVLMHLAVEIANGEGGLCE